MCVIFNSNLDLLVPLTKEKINKVLKENQHGALSRNPSRSSATWFSLLIFSLFIFIFRVRPCCINHHHHPSVALASSDVEFHVVARLDQVGKGAYSCDIYPSQPYCLPIA